MMFINKTLKKKTMLDLFIKKKLSSNKKRIIQTYGKDMIAEMYLDLLNLQQNKKNSNNNNKMQNYSRNNSPNQVAKQNSNKDSKLKDKSIFGKSLKIDYQKSTRTAGLSQKTLVEDLKNSSFINRFKSVSTRSKPRTQSYNVS
jgi:hypothetical protein